MNNFIEEERYSLSIYELSFQPPSPSQPYASLEILFLTDGKVHKSYNLLAGKVGLKIENNDLIFGLAQHGSSVHTVAMDFSRNPMGSAFSIGTNPQNSRLGGIGIEDLRDASRTGTVNRHYFYLDTEPINLHFSGETGYVNAEIKDPEAQSGTIQLWYEKVSTTV